MPTINAYTNTVFSLLIILTLSFIALTRAENIEDNDYNVERQRVKLNQIPSQFKEQVETYLKYNGYYEKKTVDKATFVEIFLKVITDDSFTPLQKSNFRTLGNELADREGDIIKTQDISTILNFAKITKLYSELIEEGVVNVNSEDNPELENDDTENTEL